MPCSYMYAYACIPCSNLCQLPIMYCIFTVCLDHGRTTDAGDHIKNTTIY